MKVDTFPIFESTIKFFKPLVPLKLIYYSFLFSNVRAKIIIMTCLLHIFFLLPPLP